MFVNLKYWIPLKIKIKCKRVCNQLIGKDYYPRIMNNVKTTFMGSEYGGFSICKEYVKPGGNVLSFGIGEDTSFSETLIREYGVSVWGFDPTPLSQSYVKKRNIAGFSFLPYGISKKCGKQKFYLPNDSYGDISGSVYGHENCNMKTIFVDMIDFNKVLEIVGEEEFEILKMDIEGSEFDIIDDILNSSAKIRQICIEFHQRFLKKGGSFVEESRKRFALCWI